ncbi:MAG: Bax inhibitor-1/YccA family protein [Planctomycetes bacterium]|nr:Bax inhibitor-1/YccA family protein [Planctomycetota bacterium]MBM4057534.1 Bax inhibitor-1/YccA family protein [Planctomycetota bacterium]
MRTGNPALHANTFENFGVFRGNTAAAPVSGMTINGTAQKTFFLLMLAFGAACFTWSRTFRLVEADPTAAVGSVAPWVFGGAIVGLVAAVVICFKHTWAPALAPIYAMAEGLFLGGISAGFESQYPGIVIQAVGGTFGTLFCLLLAYQSGLIRATENFKLGIVAATGGIALLYLVTFVAGLFGFQLFTSLFGSGLIGIGFSVVVVGIAALNLVLDFDFIEQAAERGVPKYLEWYGAFALMVTLVWLYLEILRLLAKLNNRR